MNNGIANVIAIVEGKTEQVFIEQILTLYLAKKNIFISATQMSKPGQKGGDVRFSRTVKDIGNHLKQRSDTYVCTFVDYYGVKEWPGVEQVIKAASPSEIAKIVNGATQQAVAKHFPTLDTEKRFIPFLAIHEFEALLFSDAEILAEMLSVNVQEIKAVLKSCKEPEAINNSPKSAPSKRLNEWTRGNFKKTASGIAIAKKIGINVMRKQCPVFDAWLKKLEKLVDKA